MTKLTLDLMKGNFDELLQGIENYEKWLDKKCNELAKKVAEKMGEQADLYASFCTWYARDIEGGADVFYTANISISVEAKENGVYLVIANGDDAVWAEFGTGVYYNGAAGSSPNPYGKELGFTIGSYGKGNGKKDLWVYEESGTMLLTHGIKATMPLYNAQKKITQEIESIVREVFGND